ncbi:Aldehyde/histidinol dehydrogenase [Penicillium argentinense]|uniref:Aldehyde/histidinol dehydrogenase n=1 Tax=Penicillium argentinense TaxID=1131581 RepID=A0A9W9EIA8_9EURO|nr:Aldehyde/histidinol dehydrogenase [Penicillium argentinense]KAJ5082328.1 Aldehyde/histidinol dehydrogenase [Penicillium argentinense]
MASSVPKLSDQSLFANKNYIEDPASGALIGSSPESGTQDAKTAIRQAGRALPAWRSRTGQDQSRNSVTIV